MPKRRLIPLLFAVAYILIPATAVYVHAKLSDGDTFHANDRSSSHMMPAVYSAPSKNQDVPRTL